MKLSFTLAELQQGFAKRRLSEKRLPKIEGHMATTGAFSLSPMILGTETATGVIVRKIEPAGDRVYTLTIDPVSCPVFEVYSLRGELNSLTLDLPRQVTIDREGTRETSATLLGFGADEVLIEKARVAFGRLISTESSNKLVRAMITHLASLKATPATNR